MKRLENRVRKLEERSDDGNEPNESRGTIDVSKLSDEALQEILDAKDAAGDRELDPSDLSEATLQEIAAARY